MELGGLHHVTAVTGDAANNVRFYTEVLGMRLVKKTVNQDDVSAYHLFYGDEVGSPGTEVTFFDWPNAGPNIPGTGTIGEIGLRVPDEDALEWWRGRLDQAGIPIQGGIERNGRPALGLTDPEGQRLALVAGRDEFSFMPWRRGPVPVAHQIRGLHHVSLVVSDLAPTSAVLTGVMGCRAAGEVPAADDGQSRVAVFEIGPGGPGAEVYVEERADQRPGRVGIGGVHHVAFRTPSEVEHERWRERLAISGLGVTPVIDRYYFRSIYFREPGHVLFEIATDGPGFATDEDPAHLGERLALPPFLEPRRAQIEAGLRPLPTGSGGASD